MFDIGQKVLVTFEDAKDDTERNVPGQVSGYAYLNDDGSPNLSVPYPYLVEATLNGKDNDWLAGEHELSPVV